MRTPPPPAHVASPVRRSLTPIQQHPADVPPSSPPTFASSADRKTHICTRRPINSGLQRGSSCRLNQRHGEETFVGGSQEKKNFLPVFKSTAGSDLNMTTVYFSIFTVFLSSSLHVSIPPYCFCSILIKWINQLKYQPKVFVQNQGLLLKRLSLNVVTCAHLAKVVKY